MGVLVCSLPAPVDPTRSDGDFGDFICALYAEYVARHGCTAADLEFSLSALRTITTRFSAEDEHYHVRRLCNEARGRGSHALRA